MVKGVVANQVIPDVPQHILDDVEGHIQVRVAVQVDAEGKVGEATLDSPGPSQYFANQALKAARGWEFKNAERGEMCIRDRRMNASLVRTNDALVLMNTLLVRMNDAFIRVKGA